MPDNPTQAPTRFYGFARARTGPDYLAALKALGGDTPTTEPEASQEASASADDVNDATSIVVPSEQEVSRGAASTIIELTSPPCTEAFAGGETERAAISRASNSRAGKKSRSRHKKKAAQLAAPLQTSERLPRLARHQAHCGICGHELQEEIDEAFVNWECVYKIADEYDIDRRAIYRHAHATGLFPKRDRNLRRALGHIIHEADRVSPSADSIVRAVRMFAHINARGDWVNPPTHVIFSSGPRLSDQDSPPQRSREASPAPPLSDTPCKVSKRLNP